ncbi:unnamed protein product [Amoebophrya sp. A25]|nr:unnamed protein product [Amoebophrya sp. A25]|eukprot:GSA25T00007806001.1
MRLVIQRVRSASVETPDKGIVGQIGAGLVVLVGICQTDTKEDMEFCARRLLRMKLFPKNGQNLSFTEWGEQPGNAQWAQTVTESNFGLLIVSQFTLHAKFKKPKPDFHCSMAPQPAKEMYEQFIEEIRRAHCAPPPQAGGGKKKGAAPAASTDDAEQKGPVLATGEFGAMMNVKLENDGPVTMIVDSDLEMGGGSASGATAQEAKASA